MEQSFYNCFATFNSSPTWKAKLNFWRDFPGSLVVKTWPSNAKGISLIPGWGTNFPDDSWPKKQNINRRNTVNKFSKDLKSGPN